MLTTSRRSWSSRVPLNALTFALTACVVQLAPVSAFGSDPADPLPATPTPLEQFTSETNEVLAMPDGTLQLTSHRLPVRTEKNGEWVDIDTTVMRAADGTVAPVATTAGVEFSGGGSADPLVHLVAGATTMDIDWAEPLPAPVLAGDTATYTQVRPGVDLVLTAQPAGYTQALVIENTAAAKALIDNPVQLSISGVGLSFTQGSDGNIVARDANGPVFTGAPAVMWDSSLGGTSGTAPDASDPGDGKIRRVATSISTDGTSMDLTLAPPASVLTDSAVTYPLYLDPAIEKSKLHYLTVHSKGWDYYDDAGQPMRVGYCGWAECNTAIQGNARSFFTFDVSAMTGSQSADAEVYNATVYAKQIHSATSTAQPVELTKASGFTASTNYPGPVGTGLQTISSNAGFGSDAGATLAFSSEAVRSYAQSAANADDSFLQFSLSAPAPDNKNYWKKFANNPSIVITFGFPPTTPGSLEATGAIDCTGKPRYVTDTTPTLQAMSNERSDDNLTLNYFFEVWKDPDLSTQSRVRYNPDPVTKASSTVASWTTNGTNSSNTNPLPAGNYGYRVMAKVNDPNATNTPSAWSAWYKFTIDTTPPSVPATTSFTYPPEYWGTAQNATGSFVATGSSDTAGFSYSIDGGVPPSPTNTTCSYSATTADKRAGYVPASSGKGTITVPVNVLTSGHHTITVKAFNDAHVMTTYNQAYGFYVSPTISGSDGKNVLEFESLTPTQPAGQGAHPNNFSTGTTWSGGILHTVIANQGSEANPTKVDYHFSVPVDGYYALGARLATANHFAKVRFTLDDPNDATGTSRMPIYDADGQTPLVIDTYSPTAGVKYVPLGEYLPYQGVLLKGGRDYTLTVEIVGTSGVNYTFNGTYGGETFTDYHDNGYSIGLDSLTVAPLRQPDFANLSAAFDNQGIGTTTAAKFDLSSNGTTSLSKAAMDAAGITPGQTYTLGGATFQIPAANGTKDNLVSSGQTISMPAATTGHNIYLLASSTCGPINSGGGRNLTIKYRLETEPGVYEYATSDPALMSVPDWLSPPGAPTADIPASVTLSHYFDGSTQVTTGTPTLYLLKFPVAADYTTEPIASVTMPRVGTTYTTGGCGAAGAAALHVFAMSVGN